MGELIESPKIVCTKEEEKGGQTETVYNRLAETRFIIVSDGFISFCAHFKYLGSWLSFLLRDDYDLGHQIGMANTSMVTLARFWYDHHVDMYSKYILLRAIPCNLLLLGFESWALQMTLLNKLEVFLHQGIRHILEISMGQVR